ncbi:RICIN domain-containing protein [Streptomyces sp. NPDC093984]|uniref:RICIN domain-containing protein n=1 Tax=Streptomyces sp. NPDC093984 TaxID=3366052 RepID=UPI003825D22D
MCLDAGPTRNNGDPVRIWACSEGNANQTFVFQDGQIKVEDTLGTGKEMCLDVGVTRNSGDPTHLWQCYPGLTNQTFVLKRGQLKVEDTIGPFSLAVPAPTGPAS